MAVALITGASRGFGRALARELAGDGWDLVVDARHPEPLDEVAESLEGSGVAVRATPGDITDPDHRQELVRAAEELGGLDLLVNNAGTLGPSPLPRLDALDPSSLTQVMVVNVVAPLALVQLALPMLRRHHGVVVAVTSDAAVEAYEGWGGYGASKAAFEQLHHVLQVEEPDLRVVRFDPGDMRTAMHQAAFPGEDISDRPEPEVAAGVLRRFLTGEVKNGRYQSAELVEALA